MRRRVVAGFAGAVLLALVLGPSASGDHALLDPAHNAALPCEFVGAPHLVPRSAKNIAHLANVCGFVGTDIEFQSRTNARGKVRDYAFVGTMGAGTRIFDITDPSHPFSAGGYVDPGYQNDVHVRGNLLVLAFDQLGASPTLSDCLKQKNATRGGIDIVQLEYQPLLGRFITHRVGCYANAISGGSHTVTMHPSGEWIAVNTSASGIEVVDIRDTDGDGLEASEIKFNRKITNVGVAHDVSFSRDGGTMYVASPGTANGTGGHHIVDVRGILDLPAGQNPPRTGYIWALGNEPNNTGNRYNLTTSHQADTTSDGKILIATDERGGGISNTACNTNPEGIIGGAHFYALAELPGVEKSLGATPATPKYLGTWFYPNPLLAADPLDSILAGMGRTERGCTIHVFRNGGNGSHGPGEIAPGFDGVSRLPVDQAVTAHYGAGVWHLDLDTPTAPGTAGEDKFTTWGRTLGWNVMPGADTWSAKEYKGYIYTGDMTRGFDVYSFTPCSDLGCIVVPTNVPGSASGGGGSSGVEAEFQIVEGVSVGGRATFGFDVSYRIGQLMPEGTLSFTDHALGKKVQATVIDSFHVAAGKATFTGRATVDKVPGVRFEVVVQDNGEPGRNDTFQIFTADGYLAGGTLAKGNVEVESDPNSIFSVEIG